MTKLLSDHAVEEAAKALNGQLRTYDCNGRPPDKRIRQAAAEVAALVPLSAAGLLLVIGYVSQVFRAAVADRIITANPLKADSIQKPAPVRTEAVPWTVAQVAAVAARMQPGRLAALPYLGAACGLRQGELFGLAAGELDFLRRTLHVEVQLKLVDGVWVFGPLKTGRQRNRAISRSSGTPRRRPGCRCLRCARGCPLSGILPG